MGYYKNLSISYGTVGEAQEDHCLDRRDYTPPSKPEAVSYRVTTPLPRFIEPGHFQIDSSTHTLVTYDLRYDHEHDNWECSCEGWFYRRDCKHVRQLVAQLSGTRPEVIQARQAIKARGITLESLFDYGNPTPPTHRATSRRQVQAGHR